MEVRLSSSVILFRKLINLTQLRQFSCPQNFSFLCIASSVYNAVNDYVVDCFQELENLVKSEVGRNIEFETIVCTVWPFTARTFELRPK